jgi:hypothetical protein
VLGIFHFRGHFQYRAVSICSDSRAALLALKSCAVSSRFVLQCGDSLQELALSNRVRLVWVSGQYGINGNEEADTLAIVGSSSAFVELWHLRVSSGGSESGYLYHTAPHEAWRLLVVSREYG